MACVYVLKNKINGKCYVGQTIQTFKRRFEHHLDNKDCNMVITRAIKKQGEHNFEKHIYYLTIGLLDYFEIELIKRLNTIVPNGYNLDSGGNKSKTKHPDTIKRQSESHMGHRPSDETKQKHRDLWKNPEYRQRMSEKHKGKSPGNKGVSKYPAYICCANCKIEFKRNTCWNKKRRFCSRKCFNDFRKKNGASNKNIGKIYKNCIYCGNIYYSYIWQNKKYCSFSCYLRAVKKEG